MCEVCGGTEFSLIAGHYYCDECQTQSQHMRETVDEGGGMHVMATSNIATSQTTLDRSALFQQKSAALRAQVYISEDEAVNLLLQSCTSKLLRHGCVSQLRSTVLENWRDLLASEHRCPARLLVAVGVLAVSLLQHYPQFVVSDVIRWTRQFDLPIFSALNELPQDAHLRHRGVLTVYGDSVTGRRVLGYLHTVFACLGQRHLTTCSHYRLMLRFCHELALPRQLALVAYNLFLAGYRKLFQQSGGRLTTKTRADLALYPPEIFLMCAVLAALKLLFGLDDCTETQISRVASVHNAQLPPESDSVAESDSQHWFVLTDWLRYIHLRSLAVGGHHLPSLHARRLYDPCRPEHRRLLYSFYWREAMFADMTESTGSRVGNRRRRCSVTQPVLRLFGISPATAADLAHCSVLDDPGFDCLWHPFSARLQLVWPCLSNNVKKGLSDCGNTRSASINYLLDNESTINARCADARVSVRVRVVDRPARVRIARPSIDLPISLGRRTVNIVDGGQAGSLKDTADHGSKAKCRTARPSAGDPGSRIASDDGFTWLKLHRPCNHVWMCSVIDEVKVFFSQGQKLIDRWPESFKFIASLLADTVEADQFEFYRCYAHFESAVFPAQKVSKRV